MATKYKYYLAYGSNLHVAQMQRRCPGAQAVGTAWLDGWRLAFRGSKTGAYLTIVRDNRARTPVGIWKITAGHEQSLDMYEGFPTFYYKETMRVHLTPLTAHGRARDVDAMVYIMDPSRPEGVPSQMYVDVCSVGYDCFGFDKAPLLRAVSDSLAHVRRAPVKQSGKKVSA